MLSGVVGGDLSDDDWADRFAALGFDPDDMLDTSLPPEFLEDELTAVMTTAEAAEASVSPSALSANRANVAISPRGSPAKHGSFVAAMRRLAGVPGKAASVDLSRPPSQPKSHRPQYWVESRTPLLFPFIGNLGKRHFRVWLINGLIHRAGLQRPLPMPFLDALVKSQGIALRCPILRLSSRVAARQLPMCLPKIGINYEITRLCHTQYRRSASAAGNWQGCSVFST